MFLRNSSQRLRSTGYYFPTQPALSKAVMTRLQVLDDLFGEVFRIGQVVQVCQTSKMSSQVLSGASILKALTTPTVSRYREYRVTKDSPSCIAIPSSKPLLADSHLVLKAVTRLPDACRMFEGLLQ